MEDNEKIVRERFVLTVDQTAAALTETVLRAQVQSAEDQAQGGALGTLLRVDRFFDGAERLLLRLVLAGLPLALGAYLIFVGHSTYGVLALVASPLVLLVVMVFERAIARLGRSVDAVTDPRIVASGGRRLKAAIESGQVEVLRGTVDAELSGDQLRVCGASLTVTIPSVHTAWRARTPSHFVLSAHPPGLRPEFAQCALLPADGEIAAAIARLTATES